MRIHLQDKAKLYSQNDSSRRHAIVNNPLAMGLHYMSSAFKNFLDGRKNVWDQLLTVRLPYIVSNYKSDLDDAASLEFLAKKEVASNAVCLPDQQDRQARADTLDGKNYTTINFVIQISFQRSETPREPLLTEQHTINY